MSTRDYNQTMTEAVAVFHDIARLQDAVDELLTRGFDHAELSILSSREDMLDRLARRRITVSHLEDDPAAPRSSFIPEESYGDAEGAILAILVYLAAMLGIVVAASAGGSLFTISASAVAAGASGGLFGLTLAALFRRTRSRKIFGLLEHGGLLLWVRTHNSHNEQLALEILQRHSAEDVHLHQIPDPPRCRLGIPTRRPALSFGRAA